MISLRDARKFRLGRSVFVAPVLFYSILGDPLIFAGELGSTKITAIRNVVEHNDGQAKKSADVGQTVTQGQSVLTKEQALAELVADDSSVIRLGANSVFSYNSKERIVKLDKGTMLMHTPPGNGGATIDSGGVVGAISGTTFMLTASPAKCSECGQELQVNEKGKVLCREHPNNPPTSGGFALIVLEGGSVTKVTGSDGITVDVVPGQMAVVGPKGSGAPKVFAVNITQIARTSPLINAFPNPLPSLPQIMNTAFNLQNQNLNTTGTSAVAISSKGQLLTGNSPAPSPFLRKFLMAFSQPGQNNSGNFNNNLGNIATAAGGGGAPITPTGVAGGGGGPGLPPVPSVPAPPSNIGQQGVSGNSGTLAATPVSVIGASVITKVYDGTRSANIVGAALSSAVAAGVALANDTTGLFAGKDVGAGIAVSASMSLTGASAPLYNLSQPNLIGTILAKPLTMIGSSVAPSKPYDGNRSALVTVGSLSGEVRGETLGGTLATGTYNSKDVLTASTVTVAYTLVDGLNGELASNYSLANDSLGATITAKNITMTASTVSKVYDGNNTASVTLGTLSGRVGSEQLLVTLTGGAGTFSSANVGGTSTVIVGYTLADDLVTGGLVSNYNLTNPTETLNGAIMAKDLQVFNGMVTTKNYDGTVDAVITGAVLVGNSTAANDGKYIGTETVTLAGGASGSFTDRNVGTAKSVTTAMTLGGADSGNYTLSQPTLTGTITQKDLQIGSMSVRASKVYDGTRGTVLLTAASFGTTATTGVATIGDGLAYTIDDVQVDAGGVGTYNSKDVGAATTVVFSGVTLKGNEAGNYNPVQQGSVGATITKKDLQIGSMSVAASKVYDGTRGTVLLTAASFGTTATTGVGTEGNKLAYTIDDVQVDAGGVGTYNSKDVTAATAVSFSGVTLKGNQAGNYNPLQQADQAATITAKDLTVVGTTVTTRAYNGGIAATLTGASLQAAIAAGTGIRTDGKPFTGDTITLGNSGSGTFARSLPGTLIPVVAATMTLGGADAGNYQLVQPTGLKGEITGSATLDRNGAALNVNATEFLHVRNTTAFRMQDGMQFKTTAGEVLIEDSSFDGWMKRTQKQPTQELIGQKDHLGNQMYKIEDGGATTFQFNESAAVAANSPVLRIKLEANDPTLPQPTQLDYMLLGDYQMHLRHDPDGSPASGDETGQTIFNFPGRLNDLAGIGSLAPSADLVIRDSAGTSVANLPTFLDNSSGLDPTQPSYSDYFREFSSLDSTTKEAVWSGNYAPASGEYKPDGSAAMSDLDTATSAGNWDVTVSDPVLGGEGKVTDLRLKYNNNTKVLVEGPDGVRLLNVKFEGMDEVDVRTTDLNNRVLMSATLVTDPDISKLVVKTGTKLEAFLNSDATFQKVKSLNNAELLAGVRYNTGTGKMEFILGPERTLTIDGPGAASATPNINIAGQLNLAAHTVVFNNANIVSGGVIDVRTRDGMVNRTYGAVVPGTVSFMGANGNYFLNTGNSQSMTIANSADIGGAFTGGKLTDVGSGGTGTVMSVGKVQ